MSGINPEVIEVFTSGFGRLAESYKISSESYNGKKLPDEMVEFWRQIGAGRREDGFIWIVDPNEFSWLKDIFDIGDYIPFARNSFDDVFLLNRKGACFELNASSGEIVQTSLDFETTLLNMSDKELTDDEILYKRHMFEWGSGNKIDKNTCYCLKPVIPLGGSYEESDIYIGKTQVYFDILSQSQ